LENHELHHRVILTPTEEWLRDAISECESRFVAASPFVGRIFAELITELLADDVTSVLVTQVNLKYFASGFSDIEAVSSIAERGTVVKSLPRLHAKVYISDSKRALVTSGNATEGGLRRNLECGIAVDDTSTVKTLVESVLSGFGTTGELVTWEPEKLRAIEKQVNFVKEALPNISAPFIPQIDRLKIEIPDKTKMERIVSLLGGWTSLTLKGILSQKTDVFSLDELFAVCEPEANLRYPNNRHVRAKLRQQLQRLRDLGLVEFHGDGIYRRLISLRGE